MVACPTAGGVCSLPARSSAPHTFRTMLLMAPGSGPHRGGAVRYELAHSTISQFGGPLPPSPPQAAESLDGEENPGRSPSVSVWGSAALTSKLVAGWE